jgi:hypothetical protein
VSLKYNPVVGRDSPELARGRYFRGMGAANGHLSCTRHEVFMTVKIQVEVFWIVKPCSVALGYLYHNPEDLDLNLHVNVKLSLCLKHHSMKM